MIPITIVTGFLGSGKTTLILNLITQLPKNYKLALLKNEFGDVAVDSQLAASSAISGVQELLNGCICCNLVGQLSDALATLARNVVPDRIVIETSGSAFPATLAMEVNRLSRETGLYVLDGVMSVVDVENWQGYEDTSYTAKMQAKYTDLIVLNKWELVNERRLEDVEDAILSLEVDPPTPRCKSDKGWVSKDIVFGLDANLAKAVEATAEHDQDHDQDRNQDLDHVHRNNRDWGHNHDHSHEVEVLNITLTSGGAQKSVDIAKLIQLLRTPTKDAIYRIKGVLHSLTIPTSSDDLSSASGQLSGSRTCYILNWAFGRWRFTEIPKPTLSEATGAGTVNPDKMDPLPDKDDELRLTVITARYESKQFSDFAKSSGTIRFDDGSDGVLTIERTL